MTSPMDINLELERIAEEAYGEILKQAEMINVTFTLQDAEVVTFEDEQTGEPRHSYKATIQIDDEPPVLCWLGGRIVFRQVEWLLANGKLPLIVKLIRDAALKGQPYKLQTVAAAPKATRPKGDQTVELLAAALAAVGEVAVFEALGDYADLLSYEGDAGILSLNTKGMKLADIAKVQAILRRLA